MNTFKNFLVCTLIFSTQTTCAQSNHDVIKKNIDPKTTEATAFDFVRNPNADTMFDYRGALEKSGIASDSASFYVQAINQQEPLVSSNAERAQNPASVIKLLTTFAALKTLGPSFRWQNQMVSTGMPDANGVLHQPLYLKGSGDPHFVIEKIDELVQDLAKNGVKKIDAPIIVDRSAFEDQRQDASTFDGEPSMPYNAQPDAELMNFRSLNFDFNPDTQQITLVPWLLGYHIDNHVQWIDGACPSSGWKSSLNLSIEGNQASMGGKYYRECGTQTWHFHAYKVSANDYVKGILGSLMTSAGIKPTIVDMNAPRPLWTDVIVQSGKAPANAHVLASSYSSPLTDDLRDMNRYSNNVMARQTYLTLSLKENGLGTLSGSRRIVQERLAEQGLKLNSLRMTNGSGLSHDTAISAADLGRMLVKVANDPYFIKTLAVLGENGTVKSRLANTDMVGRGYLKTGTLNDVRAIAGYIDGKSGTRYAVVSIIQNGKAQTEAGKRVHNLFLQWVGEQ